MQIRFALLLVFLCAGLFLLSLCLGPVMLTPWDVQDETSSIILHEIRLPRALLGLLVGASLGMAGAVIQGYVRNPLAEPGLLGITNGASFGAVLAIYSGLASQIAWLLPVCGMAGAMLAVAAVWMLAGKSATANGLILAGIAVSTFAGALVAVALNITTNPFAAMEIVFWLMGSLADRSMAQVSLILLPTLIGWILLLSARRGIDALSLGEDTARSIGISMPRLRWQLLLGTSLSVGAAVSVVGSIGFVGLVVPHLLRPLVRHRPGLLVPFSGLGGAAMLLASDILVRVIPTSGMELKLGVVTSLIGGPFFLLLLLNMRRKGE